MNDTKPENPTPAAVRQARLSANLTQVRAAQIVHASLRGWQQWEAGDRAMPMGLFELFMLKTRQWPLDGDTGVHDRRTKLCSKNSQHKQ